MSADLVQRQARQRVPALLEEWSGEPVVTRESSARGSAADLELRWGGRTVFVEVRAGSRTAQVASGIQALRLAGEDHPAALVLLVVPHMGATGERLCKEARINWMDLAGNADIRASGVSIHRRGESGESPRESPGPFSPRASAVSRALLANPSAWRKQEELVKLTGLDRGTVSRVCRRLDADRLTERDSRARLRPRDPLLLLDAWREEYRPLRGHAQHGSMAVRSGPALLERIASQRVAVSGLRWTATGLAAAWLWNEHASFRRARFYVLLPLSASALATLGCETVPDGGNVDFIVAANDHVLRGAATRQGVHCVTRLQAYLDLKGEAERAEEAAADLRKSLAKAWHRHG